MLARLTPRGAVVVAALAATALLAGCGSGVDSGGLSLHDRNDAQLALNALHGSSIPERLVSFSLTAGLPPAVCRVRLESRDPSLFHVYVFWVPFIGPASYTWLSMTLAKDASRDRFHLGAAEAVRPGGVQLANGKTVAPALSEYDVPLSQYGRAQRLRNHQAIVAHGGSVFTKPGARCQLLRNGDLRLLPNP